MEFNLECVRLEFVGCRLAELGRLMHSLRLGLIAGSHWIFLVVSLSSRRMPGKVLPAVVGSRTMPILLPLDRRDTLPERLLL